jgi:hypothetical protein
VATLLRPRLLVITALATAIGAATLVFTHRPTTPAQVAAARRGPARSALAHAQHLNGARPQPARALAITIHLPVSSRWALPPLVLVTAGRAGVAAATTRRVLTSPRIAVAPRVASQLRAGADARALAPLLALPATIPGPLLVLDLRGSTATIQATSLGSTRRLVEALMTPSVRRGARLLLVPAPGDLADITGPPPPRPGELASLVPIYQLAGARYGINWRVLAAINVVETNLGSDLSTSTAGAVGWMQFMPSTWAQWGIDGNGDGVADPYNPWDAIMSAARYLQAAGAGSDLPRAIFAYNHAWWYVNRVLAIAANLPASLSGG